MQMKQKMKRKINKNKTKKIKLEFWLSRHCRCFGSLETGEWRDKNAWRSHRINKRNNKRNRRIQILIDVSIRFSHIILTANNQYSACILLLLLLNHLPMFIRHFSVSAHIYFRADFTIISKQKSTIKHLRQFYELVKWTECSDTMKKPKNNYNR